MALDDGTQKILEEKGSHVRSMFDRIAGWYDFLNHFLSLGIDRRWRRRLVRRLPLRDGMEVLDVATGTGDLAFTLLRRCRCRVTGMDVSREMMRVGEKKARRRGLTERVRFVEGAAEVLPFADESFDVVTVAFGVRNFTALERGLREMLRVLRPGGTAAILEFSRPRRQPLKALYGLYLYHLLPLAGRIFSGDPHAYTYLPESIRRFPQREELTAIMEKCGFTHCTYTTFTGGIVSAYYGKKNGERRNEDPGKEI